MAGIDVASGRPGGRKSLDSEINMVPMIDLLMVTISFLLITAVWTHSARIDSNAEVPGPSDATHAPPPPPEKLLHVSLKGEDTFQLAWKQGGTTVDAIDVPRKASVTRAGAIEVVRFPDLADRIEAEWKLRGGHTSPLDRRLDRAVVHADDKTEFKTLVGVLDAIYAARRTVTSPTKSESVAAFDVTFATN
jgi:biopolymer transport protein ExbD